MRTVRVLLAMALCALPVLPATARAAPEDEGFIYVGTFEAPRGNDSYSALLRAGFTVAGPDACSKSTTANPDGLKVEVWRAPPPAVRFDYVFKADGSGWAGPCASGLMITIKLIDFAPRGKPQTRRDQEERPGTVAGNGWWNVNTSRDKQPLEMTVTEYDGAYVRGHSMIRHQVWGRFLSNGSWMPIPCRERVYEMFPTPEQPVWTSVGEETPCTEAEPAAAL